MRRWLITITAVLLQGFTVTHPVQAQQTLLAAALIGALTLTPTLFAQDAPTTGDKPAESKPKDEPRDLDAPAKDPWQFGFFMLGWVPAVSGNARIQGNRANVGVGVDTLLKDLGGAAELGFELRRNNFGFYAQPNWISLKADAQKGGLSGEDQLKLWLVDAGGFY